MARSRKSGWISMISVACIGAAMVFVPCVAHTQDGANAPDLVVEETSATIPLTRQMPLLDDVLKIPAPKAAPDDGADLFAKTTVFSDGFEGSFPGLDWSVSGASPYWDDTSYRSRSGSWSVWCADGGPSGQPAGGDYVNNMDTWMVHGPFSLSGATSGSLSFWLWLDTELNYDYFKYLVSVNGTNFYGFQTSGNSGGWTQKTIDFTDVPTLGDITGDSSVWIAFIFESDSSNVAEGAYIDDVLVTKAGSTSSCTQSSTTMCLQDNRFEVVIDYRFNNGTTGLAQRAQSGTADSGLFYYSNPNNWEFLIKVLNGCTLNNHYWVFFAATTNQEFTVTVRDTETGMIRNYFNPLGQPADAVTDTNAFATCP